MDTFRLSEPIFMFGATELPYMAVLWTQNLRPTKLPYMAVLWTLFGCLSQNPYKTADLSSSMDTLRLSEPIFMFGATELPGLGSSTETFD